jgi:hypothetical protein
MELRVARSQKPFVVEVKRGRRGGAVAPFTVVAKAPDAAVKTAAESSFAPPPEPPKPPRRILDAIEPEPVVRASPEAEPVAADPLKRRRGRPPKVPGTPPSPRKPRPAVAEREKAPVLAAARREFPPVAADRAAPPRQPKVLFRPQSPNHGPDGGRVAQARAAQPDLAPPSVTVGQATLVYVPQGHLTHDGRVEAAISLPRGERWKRRLPKVLW